MPVEQRRMIEIIDDFSSVLFNSRRSPYIDGDTLRACTMQGACGGSYQKNKTVLV